MNTHTTLDFFHHHLTTLEKLILGIPDERMAEQFPGLPNHPAWIVPHLCLGMQFGLAMLGREGFCPEDWQAIAGMGSTPTTNRAEYPHSVAALEHYRKGHDLLTMAVKSASPADFTATNPIAPARSFFPTVGHGILYVTTLHDAHHQAQLSAWKRAAGLAKS